MRFRSVLSGRWGAAALVLSCVALGGVSAGTASCDNGSSGDDGGDDGQVNPNDGGGEGSTDGSGGEGGPDGSDPDCQVNACAMQLALGLEHACALARDGTVRCWGLNSLGQLGTGPGGMSEAGAYDTKNVGTKVMGLGPAKAITAGFYHTCALLQNGELWCWGDNSKGQLAMATDGGPQPPNPAPAKIGAAPAMVDEVQAGGWHTCVRSAGTVTCWGLNSTGQLGMGTGYDGGVNPNFVTTPTAIGGLSGVTDLGLGDQFTCVAAGGNVSCFGSNAFGQLGRGGDAGGPPFSQTPAAAMGLSSVTDVAKSNGAHQCALSGGNVLCWGRNQYAQAGSAPSVPVTIPQMVSGITGGPVEVAPGGTHTCARVADGGTVQCWGENGHGQTGDAIGDPDASTLPPVTVMGLKDAIQVASGWGDFSCAIVKGGAVWCWGANFEGQLGRGGNASQTDNVPQKVVFP